MEDTYGVHSVKLPAGHLVLYPSTSLHHVRPVTRGARVCSFFWIQSMVRDDGERTLLFDLDLAIQSIEREQPGHPSGRAAHGRLSQPAPAVGGDVGGRYSPALNVGPESTTPSLHALTAAGEGIFISSVKRLAIASSSW